jgi:hypothetical protein
MTLPIQLHLLPRGFMRIRNFGFLANRQRTAANSNFANHPDLLNPIQTL